LRKPAGAPNAKPQLDAWQELGHQDGFVGGEGISGLTTGAAVPVFANAGAGSFVENR